MPGSITVTGGSTSTQSGQRGFDPFTIIGPNDIGETIATTLVEGDNSLAVPAGSVGVILIPASPMPVVNLTLRTNLNSSDVGLPIVVTEPTIYTFPPTIPSTLIVNASAAVTVNVDLWFW